VILRPRLASGVGSLRAALSNSCTAEIAIRATRGTVDNYLLGHRALFAVSRDLSRADRAIADGAVRSNIRIGGGNGRRRA
jgi:hypothetical protein